jgi:DNA-binding MarR family transcriptional regulator
MTSVDDRADSPVPGSQLATPWLLRRASQHYRDGLRRAIVQAGCTDLPQQGFWALDLLAAGGRDATQLASGMGISKQAVSRLVEQLVAAGYIERQPHPADRRRVILVLTTRGDRAAGVLRTATDQTEQAVVDRLGREGLDRLRHLLAALPAPEPPTH